MKLQETQRLIKIEEKIKQIASEELGLTFPNIEFDCIPAEKMIEIMACRGPSQISHWSYGKNYEKIKTIYNEITPDLPYEVVINSLPPRAYLLNKNTLAVQALVIAHVYGHVHFFTKSKFFSKHRRDIIELMSNASDRFSKYEKKYGIENVEPIIDAGLALQQHVNPYDEETEEQKRERVYEHHKKKMQPFSHEFSDLINTNDRDRNLDIEAYNSQLRLALKNLIPVEPTEDILRFIIDNSRNLDDWEKDILEIIREEGMYYHPVIKTKTINEGFSVFVHQKIMQRLFELKLLTQEEHGQYAVSNSLVKAQSMFSINPYLVGSKMLEDIEDRWNKGKFGKEWENCENITIKKSWNKNLGLGWKKVLDVCESYNDWLFMQDFLTTDLIEELELFIYQQIETRDEIRLVRTEHTLEEIKQMILMSYALSYTPKIEVIEGRKELILRHEYFGNNLDTKYAMETIKHVTRLWGDKVLLHTRDGEVELVL
ncbi:MAG: SpoVR family protein [Candidatus Shapirobacteria bacterium]